MNTPRSSVSAAHAFARFAWVVLAVTLAVIVWGDVVQATGSGDGCGAHWPTCQGALIPKGSGLAQFIEFFHRVTSGVSLLLVLGLLLWSRRVFPKGHLARLGAVLAVIFIFTESLLGAGLVLFRLVAQDTSVARAVMAPLHFVNTLLLVASVALTAWWSVRPQKPSLQGQGAVGWALGVGVAGIVAVCISGAITSLGDTLFPVHNTTEAVARALTPGEHFLVRLRIYHPFIASAVSLYTVLAAGFIAAQRPSPDTRRLARLVGVVFVVQLLIGMVNIRLAVPLWTQLTHLLFSDLAWITWLLLGASALVAPRLGLRAAPAHKAG
ncbi:MAG: COX15/CtaA family protein [Thermaceae bacterium]|nr:COX15/CtaA family protein [Thermaceae bacterium]